MKHLDDETVYKLAKHIVQQHEEKKTLHIDVGVAAHADRTETSLFRHSRMTLFTDVAMFRPMPMPGRCFICQKTEDELGEPLEAHHLGIERCFAEAPILWELVKRDFPHFHWSKFDPGDPYVFVDDMASQGLLLCKKHHTGKGTGIHDLTFSLWLMQRYLEPGYQYTPQEVIEHVLVHGHVPKLALKS